MPTKRGLVWYSHVVLAADLASKLGSPYAQEPVD